MSHNLLSPLFSRACDLQQEKALQPEAWALQQKITALLLQLEKARRQQQRHITAKNKMKSVFSKNSLERFNSIFELE